MNKGYSFFAGNHWYIMQTEKTKVSQGMIKQFVKAHADRTGCSDSWFVKEILASTKELADVRKRIDTCVFEERECVIDLDGKTETRYHIETGNSGRPHDIGNYKPQSVTFVKEENV